jgi:ketosteroid isomerase-like protein
MTAPVWLQPLFAAIDRRDADAFVTFLTDDATFRFANADGVVGRAAIREAVGGFFASIASLDHTLDDVWTPPGAVIVHGSVTYTRHDGSRLSVPFANVFKLQGEKIRDYLIFLDASQLYVPA